MADMIKKVTKKDNFAMLKELAVAAQRDDLVEFIDAQVESLDKRAAKAKEYKAKKAKASDALTEKIAAALTGDFQNAETITAKVAGNDETITKAKVVARLGALVRDGKASKSIEKEGKRRLTVYALPEVAAVE